MKFWTGRRVLVTGCTGFLGYWLTTALVERGAEVTGVVRDTVSPAPFFRNRLAARINIVHGSVVDYGTVERCINEYEIDTVFHLAAQTIVGVANRSPLATFETNIKGSWVVLEACRHHPAVTRLVLASSDKAYGVHAALPYDEDFPLRGSHPYDVSKSCADLIAAAYHQTYRTPVCITRCGNLFGPGDINYNRLIPGTIRSAVNGEAPIIRSDGTAIRDYLFVHDAVAGYLALAERMDDPAIHGGAFNFGTGEPVSVTDVVWRILRVAEREDLQPVIQNAANGEIPRQYLSARRAEEVLGWRPGAPLDARLRETIAWYRGFGRG